MASIKIENGCGNRAAPEVPDGNDTGVTQPVNSWTLNLECGCWDDWYGLVECGDELFAGGND